jgi:hypothetical protein
VPAIERTWPRERASLHLSVLQTFTMMIEFNDTPEGLVVDIEMIAGIPSKGYDERSPLRGYKAAAGLNEMALAPAFAGKRGAYFNWVEAFDAITRHAIEEFTNPQFFLPYYWAKYAPLGKLGVNWIPTLGTWMQNNKISIHDGRSISFYNALLALSNSLVNKSNTTHAAAIDAVAAKANATYVAATDAATAAVVAKSQAYVQPANAITKVMYESNKANGAKPDAVNTYGMSKGNKTVGVTVNHGNGSKPLEGLQAFLKSKLLRSSNDTGGLNINLGLPILGHHLG